MVVDAIAGDSDIVCLLMWQEIFHFSGVIDSSNQENDITGSAGYMKKKQKIRYMVWFRIVTEIRKSAEVKRAIQRGLND